MSSDTSLCVASNKFSTGCYRETFDVALRIIMCEVTTHPRRWWGTKLNMMMIMMMMVIMMVMIVMNVDL